MAFSEAMRLQSKCRDDLGRVYERWAVRAVEGAGLVSVQAMAFDSGQKVGVQGEKSGQRHAASFTVSSTIISDIYEWARAL